MRSITTRGVIYENNINSFVQSTHHELAWFKSYWNSYCGHFLASIHHIVPCFLHWKLQLLAKPCDISCFDNHRGRYNRSHVDKMGARLVIERVFSSALIIPYCSGCTQPQLSVADLPVVVFRRALVI